MNAEEYNEQLERFAEQYVWLRRELRRLRRRAQTPAVQRQAAEISARSLHLTREFEKFLSRVS